MFKKLFDDFLLKLLYVVIILCLIGIVFCGYMLVRNNWVHNHRIEIHNSNQVEYETLWSYDKMMHNFWIWDVNSMKNDEQ